MCENYVQQEHVIIFKDPEALLAETINMKDLSNSYVAFDLPEVPTGDQNFAHDLVLLQSPSQIDFFAYYNTEFLLRMSYNQTCNAFVIAERIPLPEHLDLVLKRSFEAYHKVFSSKHILIKNGQLHLLARKTCVPGAEGSNSTGQVEAMALSLVSLELYYPY